MAAAPGHRFDTALRASRRAGWLIGVDEAGRGPWAGPVVVAAVRLGSKVPAELLAARDSKQLCPARRQTLFGAIRARAAAVSVAWAYPREIEETDILAATLAAIAPLTLANR